MTLPGQLGGVMRPLALGVAMLGCAQPAVSNGAGSAVALPHAREQHVTLVQSVRTSYAEVIDALDRNGYQIVSVANTMLNRVVIRARNERHLREIVLSRA